MHSAEECDEGRGTDRYRANPALSSRHRFSSKALLHHSDGSVEVVHPLLPPAPLKVSDGAAIIIDDVAWGVAALDLEHQRVRRTCATVAT